MLIQLIQYTFYIIMRPVFFYFLKAQVKIEKNFSIEKNKKYIIVMNHPSKLDPFLIPLMPWRVIYSLTPFTAPVTEIYYTKFLRKLFLKLINAYPIKIRAWTLEEFLGETAKRLNNQQTVIFFPEGKVTTLQAESKPRAGLNYLLQIENTEIIPIKIKGIELITLSDFFLRRRKLNLKIGSPINPGIFKKGTESPIEVSKKIMGHLYSL